MYLKTDYLIKKQLLKNKAQSYDQFVNPQVMKKLASNALDQLSMTRVKSKEMEYHQIQLFLLTANTEEAISFYQKLKQCIHEIFMDEKSKKIFEQKWSHSLKRNIVGLFNRIAKDFLNKVNSVDTIFSKLYGDTMNRLLAEDKISRIQQKFLDSLITQMFLQSESLQVLGGKIFETIMESADKCRKRILEREIPKSLSNLQFLQYSIISLLQMQLPHEKYLYNQLLHAPNPKFLLPFHKKNSFTALGSQILLKLSKVDMQSFLYWNYFECEEGQKQGYQLYNRIRKAAGWQTKIDIMLIIIKSKVKMGIQKYMNLINQKIKFYSNHRIDQNAVNDITSYVEICLEICKKRSDADLPHALEKVDIGQAFQHKNVQQESRLKDTMLKLIELYLILLNECPKKNLKLRFIRKIVVIICKMLKNYNQQKFTNQITHLVLKIGKQFSEEEKTEFIFVGVENVNREWEKQQENSSNQIVKINQFVVSFLADFTYEFGLEDYGRPDFKVLKLELFYIMALNYKEMSYFESKKKFSLVRLDINHSLANNSIFNMLSMQKNAYENFKQHLRTIFGSYQLKKIEHEGLLAVVDEIVTFRIQSAKSLKNLEESGSFYAFLVDLLEQTERIDATGNLLKLVKAYFEKCIKTYFIEMSRLKFQDSGKEISVLLLSIDISFLSEGSISANPLISKFCQNALNDYIENYPELAFDTRILTVQAECISLLYRKSTEEYESKAEKIKGKYLVSNLLIPTRVKQVTNRLIFLMTTFYHIILKGHCINDNYLRIRILYLVKENSKTANLTFGWKYLKHIITNFKEDNSFIRNEVLMNNSCAWFINEEFYSRKLKEMKPDKILLDKCLLPIHKMKCESNDLKLIFQSVEPQFQIEFLIIPPENTENQISDILSQLEHKCELVQNLYLSRCYDQIEQEQNKIYDTISRIKTIYIQKNSAVEIFSRLVQICRKFNNHELFKYIFLKIVPLLFCMTDISPQFLSFASEALNYIVQQFNSVSILYLQKSNDQGTQDTFNIKSNHFDSSIQEYQLKQKREFIHGKLSSSCEPCSNRYIVLKLHQRRLFCLQKMYKYFMKFLSEHLHVFVAKGIPLMEIAQIFKINFNIDLTLLEFLSLESICYSLTSHLELVNLLKASFQKGQTAYDEAFIDDFYYKSLRMGLFHFQKRKTFYEEEMLNKISKNYNIKSLKTKISFFIQICDYLRNNDFHRFKKKKLPKREQIFQKKNDENQLEKILKYNQQKTIDRTDVISYNQDTKPMHQSKKEPSEMDIDMTILRYGLLYLISEQIDRIKAYSFMELNEIENPYSLSGKKRFIHSQHIISLYKYFGDKSLILIYTFAKIFGRRIDNVEAIEQIIKEALTINPDYGFPEFLELFIDQNKKNANMLKRINYWKPPNIQILFNYLSPQYERYPYLQLYSTKILSRLKSDQILFYLPQIYQALTLKSGQIVYNFLLQYARKSASFAHQLIWISKVESKIERDPHNKNPRLPGVDENLVKLQIRSTMLTKDIIRQFTREQKQFFKQVDEFYEQITAVSGKLDPKWPFADKKQRIQEQLKKVYIPKSVYLPTNPFYQVTGLKIQSGTPMQSAAKCPFLLTFKCKKYGGPDKDFEEKKLQKNRNNRTHDDFDLEPIREQQIPHHIPINMLPTLGSVIGKNSQRKMIKDDSESKNSDKLALSNIKLTIQTKKEEPQRSKSQAFQTPHSTHTHHSSHQTEISCIFKVFDDIRQDSLALQVIQLFLQIFQKHNLELNLFPYKTISNRTGKNLNIGGIIEVVPKTVSRDSIGKTNQQSLYQFFINNFGPEHNIAFQQARENFIKSQAAYSIISYILQIKDRHNGNILINKEEGFLVHIDFGFIFDISPANNLRFEKADFKLTEQMIKIMGGKMDSEAFKLYMSLVIKGFLIVRKYHKHLINIIKLMFNSGLPCFLEKSLINLEKRFVLSMSEIQAAEYMKNVINKAADHWTTNWYDKIQWIQQRIYH